MSRLTCLTSALMIAVLFPVISAAQNDAAQAPVSARIIWVKKIWDDAPHNAFTDLVRWQDRFYCAFREGKGHAGDIGKLRVLVSEDGETWRSAALLEDENYDLRDADISVTPDDRLMVLGGAQRMIDGVRYTGTFVSFTSDGETFTQPKVVIPYGRWLWRVSWHEGKAYGITYSTPSGQPFSSLVTSEDGERWTVHVPGLLGKGWPTEAVIQFTKDNTAYILHRRDGSDNSAYFGKSHAPYTDWQWHDLGRYIGGPNFIELPSGTWLAAGRLSTPEGSKTELLHLDVQAPKATPILRLPSGGDTSYPGLVWHDGALWMSYYASHEGKSSIYLAKIEVSGE